jgi:2-polyprenyl-6-hydroxyphenyl methylase/3-demethylubiquinone-9 3-methyltransferase
MTDSTPKATDWKRYNKNPTNSHQYLLPLVASLGRRLAPRKVLDIGTGNGASLPTWLEQGWKVCATEPDREGYEIARSFEGVDVRQLGVGDLLPAEWRNAFDLVICLEVVEHLFDPHQLVKVSRDTLKPGGYAIISTPYHGYVKNLALSLVDKWDFHHHPDVAGGHIKFWSKPTLKALFEKNGFKAVSFHGAGRLPHLWKSMVWVFLRP